MSSLRKSQARKLALISVAAVALVATPAHAQRAGSAITQQEAAHGAEYHPQFLEEFGGAMTGTSGICAKNRT